MQWGKKKGISTESVAVVRDHQIVKISSVPDTVPIYVRPQSKGILIRLTGKLEWPGGVIH